MKEVNSEDVKPNDIAVEMNKIPQKAPEKLSFG